MFFKKREVLGTQGLWQLNFEQKASDNKYSRIYFFFTVISTDLILFDKIKSH